ncbi:MAG TPA: hypothetical protein VLA12_17715, partial [Planctomycetaceae bacterium]|nr:hypothetical protein [Planctomycetaceae bacterium]
MIDKDLDAKNPAAVVLEFSIGGDSESANAVQSEAAFDDIFDVAGQTIEATVDDTSDDADCTVVATVETAASSNSTTGSDEPVVLYSVYDAGSEMTGRLVESLNASNAPPSQTSGDTGISSSDSFNESAEASVLPSQDVSVLSDGGLSGLLAPVITITDTGIALNIGDGAFVLVADPVTISSGIMTVTDGVTLLTNAEVISFDVSGAAVFVG